MAACSCRCVRQELLQSTRPFCEHCKCIHKQCVSQGLAFRTQAGILRSEAIPAHRDQMLTGHRHLLRGDGSQPYPGERLRLRRHRELSEAKKATVSCGAAEVGTPSHHPRQLDPPLPGASAAGAAWRIRSQLLLLILLC